MKYIPKSVTCLQFALQTFRKHPRCRQAFRACCEFVQQHLDQDQNLILGRNGQSGLIPSDPNKQQTDKIEISYCVLPLGVTKVQ